MPRHYINATTIKLYPQMAAYSNLFTLNINLETMLIRAIILLITEISVKRISPFSPITSHHQDFSSLFSFNIIHIYCTLTHLWKAQEDPKTGKFQGQGPMLWRGSRCKQLCNIRKRHQKPFLHGWSSLHSNCSPVQARLVCPPLQQPLYEERTLSYLHSLTTWTLFGLAFPKKHFHPIFFSLLKRYFLKYFPILMLTASKVNPST